MTQAFNVGPGLGCTFGLGCVNLGDPSSGGRRGGTRLVHRALELGVQFFDTADSYGGGTSERVLGRALHRHRDKVIVATKAGYIFRDRGPIERAVRRAVPPVLRRAAQSRLTGQGTAARLAGGNYSSQDFSEHYLRTALDASLRRLGTDYVDLYQLHAPPGAQGADVISALMDLQIQGKIRGFGVGLGGLDAATDWLESAYLSSIQVPFGVLDRQAGATVIPHARAHHVPVIARGIFAGGLMTGQSGVDAGLRPDQSQTAATVRRLAAELGTHPLRVAASFVTATPGITTALVGTTSVRHLEESIRFVEDPPLEEVLVALASPSRIGDQTASARPAGREAP